MVSKVVGTALVCTAFLTASTLPVAAQPAAKIGVFDAQRISQETAEGSKIHAKLEALQNKKRAELKKLSDELDKLQQEFVQQAATLSEDKRKEMSIKIDRKQNEIEGMRKSAQAEIQLEVEQAQQEWQKRVLDGVVAYGKEKGFTLILPVEVVGYAASSIDVTGELIQIIDKAPAPAAAPAAAQPTKPPGK